METFNRDKLVNCELQPLNADELPWNERSKLYFSVWKEGLKINKENDFLFDKFDRISDLEVIQQNTDLELIDYRFKLNVEDDKRTEMNDDKESDFLNLFEKIGLGEDASKGQDAFSGDKGMEDLKNDDFDFLKLANDLKKDEEKDLKNFEYDEFDFLDNDNDLDFLKANEKEVSDEKQSKDNFDLTKLANHKESANGQELKDDSLNDLRTQLGLFEDLDTNEFPDIAKLCEDIENKSQDDHLNELRTQLTSTSTFDIPEEPKKEPTLVLKYFTNEELIKLYNNLNENFTASLPGVTNKFTTFTIQFGSLITQNENNKLVTFENIPKITPNSIFKFSPKAPFINDLATSLPSKSKIPFTRKFQIKLLPSITQSLSSGDSLDSYLKFPPVEILIGETGNKKIDYNSVEIVSVESMNLQNIYLEDQFSDLQISRQLIGDLNINAQPNLDQFLNESQLKWGKFENNISNEIKLLINGKEVKYSYVEWINKTEFKFKFENRDIILNMIDGGELGNKSIEVMMGEGQLTKDEFVQFFNDSLKFLQLIK
ncbi:unnamed protein product [Candida verbasci]|uniref:SLS1 C-terminal domain-containing protein n=1 Tax=Candida verbasci TaxID=1227364 RepID=A0A9W4TZH4_9ASCO|nr:unnamed protein product [Candida verbasci]